MLIPIKYEPISDLTNPSTLLSPNQLYGVLAVVQAGIDKFIKIAVKGNFKTVYDNQAIVVHQFSPINTNGDGIWMMVNNDITGEKEYVEIKCHHSCEYKFYIGT